MRVRTLMTKDVCTISPERTLREAAVEMRTHGVGVLPVCVDGNAVGTITDRDLATRAVAEGLDPSETKVRDCMSEEPCWCWENDTLDRAALIMQARHVRRLIVLDSADRLAGIISIDDFAASAKSRALAGDILGRVAGRRPLPRVRRAARRV